MIVLSIECDECGRCGTEQRAHVRKVTSRIIGATVREKPRAHMLRRELRVLGWRCDESTGTDLCPECEPAKVRCA